MIKSFKNPVEHPGIILKEEFLEPYGITLDRLAKEIEVSEVIINEIINQKQPITPDIALRISKFFGLSERYFIELQNEYDIRRIKERLKDEIDKINPLRTLSYVSV
ncbi:Virulence-associated protein I [Candidatus Magnetomoraceae bacterium gMMP-15]